MPTFLYQGSYTSQGWKVQLDNTDDRLAALKKMIEGAGGKVISMYYAFGPHDAVYIVEWPSNQDAAAWAISVAAGDSVKSLQTTPLMTSEEGTKALRAAASSTYRAPV